MLSSWAGKLGVRAIGYAFLGAACCGIAGGVLGYTVGGGIAPGDGGVFGAVVGVATATVLGFLGYFIAAFFSSPESFTATLGRLIPLSILGMTAGVFGGGPALLLIFFLGSYTPYWQTEAWALALAGGFVVMMLIGQIGGIIAGAKRRWGPTEERLREGMTRALFLAIQAIVIFAIISIPWYCRLARYDNYMPWRMYMGVLSGGALAPVFAGLVLLTLPALRLTDEEWGRLQPAFTLGCRLGALTLVAVLVRVTFASPHLNTTYDPEDFVVGLRWPGFGMLFRGDLVYELLVTPLWLAPVMTVTAGVAMLVAALRGRGRKEMREVISE